MKITPQQLAKSVLLNQTRLSEIDKDNLASVNRCIEIYKQRKAYCQLFNQKWWW